jgi:hypothetical protein
VNVTYEIVNEAEVLAVVPTLALPITSYSAIAYHTRISNTGQIPMTIPLMEGMR